MHRAEKACVEGARSAKIAFSLFFVCLVANSPAFAVVGVANVAVTQRNPGRVEVTYDLSEPDGRPCFVQLQLSKDGGGSAHPCLSVTGDVGESVTPGKSKKVVWTGAQDVPGKRITRKSLKVVACLSDFSDAPAGFTLCFADIPFVLCPQGTFMMGRYPGEEDSYTNEDPQHRVTIAQGFWMSKHEITQAQWQAVMGHNPSYFQGPNAGNVNTDKRPVEQVSWNAIVASGGFLETLNAKTPGMGFRLPSEAEWEYAYRAGTTTRFYWSDDPNYMEIGNYAWYSSNSDGQTHDVGGKRPNAWGLHDMSGSVWEWVQDCIHDGYTDAPSNGAAWESPADSFRVLRGGGWTNGGNCRAAFRNSGDPDLAVSNCGFRVCRSLRGR